MSAVREAELTFAALGEAQLLAIKAMGVGRVGSWEQQNLLECWLFYCRCTKIGGLPLESARRRLRLALAQTRWNRSNPRPAVPVIITEGTSKC